VRLVRSVGAYLCGVLLILLGLYASVWAWAMLIGFPMQERISMNPLIGCIAVVVAAGCFFGSYKLFNIDRPSGRDLDGSSE